MLETVLGFCRETESIGNIYVHKYIFQIYAFIIRNWIMQHGTWKVPRSEVSKLGTQGNQWYSSRPNVSSLRTQEKQMFQFEFRKKLMSHLESSQLGRVPSHSKVSQPFHFSQAFNLLDEAHPQLGREICLTQSTDVYTAQKCPLRHTQDNVWPNILAPPDGPVTLIHKVNHPRGHMPWFPFSINVFPY